MKKVIVIGANHAGTHALFTLAEHGKQKLSITTYDANDNISFLGCGMALWIGNVIAGSEGLFYATPELLEEKGIKVRMQHRLESVDFENKKVFVRNIKTDEQVIDTYDYLVLGVGSWPVLPPIPGIDLADVLYAKVFQNAIALNDKLCDPDVQKTAVVGAGYIGVELAEAFKRNGKEVTLISDEQPLNNYYDPEFQAMMADNLKANGIKLALGDQVCEFKSENEKLTKVATRKAEYPVDMALMCIGFRPATDIFKGTALKRNAAGAIEVNEFQQTNIPNVYAIGDCCDIYNNATQSREYIGLASSALRSGIVAGQNIAGIPTKAQGTQGSNAIRIFDLTLCSTGLTETAARKRGMEFDTVTVTDWLQPDFMPENEQVTLKIVWDRKTHRLIGAQMGSSADITLALHLFSMMIQEQYTVDRIALLDQFFLPHFNQPANFITKAGLEAMKIIHR